MDAPGVPWNRMGLSENLMENPQIQWLIRSCSQEKMACFLVHTIAYLIVRETPMVLNIVFLHTIEKTNMASSPWNRTNLVRCKEHPTNGSCIEYMLWVVPCDTDPAT